MVTILRVLAAVLLAFEAGCVAESPSKDAYIPEVAEEVKALRLPFDSYGFSRLEIYAIQYAEDISTRECMRELGMDWEMLPPPPRQDPDPLVRRRYGLIEPAIAARYGYHEPPTAPPVKEREAVWARRDRLPPMVRDAAYGTDGKSGCWAKANTHVREDIPGLDESALNDYSAKAFQLSQADPAVRRVVRKWSTCMRAEGFRYAHPFDALGDPAWAAESARPTAQEIAVARTDVRCKQQADLVSVWNGAEARIQRDIIRSHPGDFNGFLAARNETLRTAREIQKEEGHA